MALYSKQKLIEWSLSLYFYVFYVFQNPKNVTFYVFCFVAYVFSNYGDNIVKTLRLRGRWANVDESWHVFCGWWDNIYLL